MTTPKQQRILVTGGCGLIGAATVAELNRQGQTDITIVDRLGSGPKWRNLVGLRYREYIEVDAFRARRLHEPCRFDIVILLGACSSTTEVNASYLASNNVTDILETIEWARRPVLSKDLVVERGMHRYETFWTNTTPPRIIYASSAATYGLGAMDDALSPTKCRPLNPYGLSKNMVDQALEARGLLDRVVGLKVFNCFGPGEQHKGDMRSVVAKGYDEIVRTGQMTLFEMPTDRPIGRDFLYVKDAAAITVWFALDPAGRAASGLFNIGSSVASTWDELAASLFAALGRAPSIQRVPMPDHLKGRYQYYTRADISRLRAAGYSATITPLAQAVDDYVKQYLVPDRQIA